MTKTEQALADLWTLIEYALKQGGGYFTEMTDAAWKAHHYLRSRLSTPAPPEGEEERKEMVAYIDNLQANGKDLDPGMGEEIKSILLAPAPDITIGEPIQIVFDGPPAHESGRFVEVEQGGKGINFGEWKHREDGYWVLELPRILQPKATVTREWMRKWAIEFAVESKPYDDVIRAMLREIGVVVEEGK